MTTERPLWSKPADSLEARSAEPDPHSSSRDAEPARDKRADTSAPPSRSARAGESSGRDWGWARTLRFAIVVSALFWLIVGLSMWAFFNAG
jgi:hypothetical protein